MVELERLRSWRRDLHRFPELGWREFRTTAFVADRLTEFGYDVHLGADAVSEPDRFGVPDEATLRAARERALEEGASRDRLDEMGTVTGVVAERSFGDGPTVGVRVDIDALSLVEAAGTEHRPAAESFASRHEGAMHACGHDGHAAMGLGVAAELAADQGAFDGTLKLLFQPAEEGARGGYAMSRSDHLDDVEYLFAVHLGLGVPSGEVVAGAEQFLASTKLDAEFLGAEAHAGKKPHGGANALYAASVAAQNLLALPRHGEGATRVNVGRMEGGAARNAIPSHASVAYEVRGTTTAINEFMESRSSRVVEASATMAGVDSRVRTRGKALSVDSSPELVSKTAEALRRSDEFDAVRPTMAFGGSEDATFLMREVQRNGGEATYLVVGTDLASGHHTGEFDFDESSLARGTNALASLLRGGGVVGRERELSTGKE